ncbi:MAG: DUF2721 domain-containing protein [Gammaproteobacteria bacterium]|jgi:hypothetical protein
MFESMNNIGDVTSAVQLALAPAFLLTGMAGLLGVMTNRLARIIDRGRYLTEDPSKTAENLPAQVKTELQSLEQRRNVASAAITMCVLSALLVCSVVAVFFFEALLVLNLDWLVGLLFMGATITLVISLAFFLREVHLATRGIRIIVTPEQKK